MNQHGTNGKSHAVWAIVGGGNGGLAVCAYLGMKGYRVRLLTHANETIEAIDEQGGVRVSGKMVGLGKVEFAGNDPNKVFAGATIIMIILPAPIHEAALEQIGPYLEPGQLVILHPGMTLGAVACQHTLRRVDAEVCGLTIAEAQTLIFACRKDGPASVVIHGVKNSVPLAALPIQSTHSVLDAIGSAFPQFCKSESTLATGLGNINAVIHPAPTLLNCARLEHPEPWTYFHDGLSPLIGSFLERIDAERLAVGRAFGMQLPSLVQTYRTLYQTCGESLHEILQSIEPYKAFPGPHGIDTRYLHEDIPFGLVPMASMARLSGTPCEHVEATINLASLLLGIDHWQEGRTLARLGLESLTVAEFRELCTYGFPL